MLVLPMTAPCPHEEPTVGLQHSYQIADFHGPKLCSALNLVNPGVFRNDQNICWSLSEWRNDSQLCISHLALAEPCSGGRPKCVNMRAIHTRMNSENPARMYHMREMSGRLFGCRLDWIA